MNLFKDTFMFFARRNFFDWMPDKLYLKLCYKCKLGKNLNLKNPQSFNEKLQWLKLYDRRPEYIAMVDKYAVKDYVASIIGAEYIIPTLGVWDRFEDIDFDSLPNQFVLKCTHDSGGLVICKDKTEFNIKEAQKKLNRHLKKNYFYSCREWPYKNVKPRIIAEEYLEEKTNQSDNTITESSECLTDYKFFCFNGVPEIFYISKDHSDNPTTDFFDMDFNSLPIKMRDPNSEILPEKPINFEKMKEFAQILSEGIAHLRVDFYSVDNHIYVGELTFYHCSGFAPITPSEWDYKMGEWIKLPID